MASERTFQRRLIQAAVASCFATAVQANPTGPSVVSGAATFNAVGKNLTVTNSPGAIINWQGFSIRADEVTRFVQSGAASAVLNRVSGAEQSQLLGQLLSNGRVFLINPNGVTIGAGARIDTAGFVASSLNLSNEDFLAGKFRFTDPGNAGKVTNAGTISAHSGGPVYLVAPTVENHGVITSPGGDVMLAAGKSVELVSAASPHLRVEVQAGGEALNVGRLIAESGRVGLYGTAVRNSGTVSADSAQVTAAGTVVLRASKDVTLDSTSVVTANGAQGGAITVQAETGTLLADGRIEATGSEARGGEVRLLGERVGLMNRAVVDVSGSGGGGTILAGGDYQGKNAAVQNARVTYVSPDAKLVADARGEGDGGKVIVWADGTTRYAGSISARGGDGGGNGGFAEVSGKETLEFTGTADLRASRGTTGTLLLDPKFILIQAGGPAPVATNDQFAENPAGTSVISGANLATAINGASVTLQANTDITFDDNVTAATANRNLTLQAGRSILFNAGRVVTLNDSQFTATINDAGAQVANRDAGAAQFVMNAGSGIVTQGKTAGTRGNVAINVGNFGGSSAGSQVTLLGGATINANGTANRAAGTVTIAGTNATTVNTAGGTITANGGANGAAAAGRAGGAVAITGGSVTTGPISARGSDGVGANNVGGTGGAVTLTANAVAGALQVNGAVDTRGGNSVGTGNAGAGGAVILRTANNGTITSTAAGTVTTTGGRGQIGGNFTVTSVTPATDTVATVNLAGAINVDGGVTAVSGTLGGKNAGAVAMANVNAVTVGAISARGTSTGGAAGNNNAGGNGGAVTIDARNATPSIALTGAIDTRGGDGAGTANAGNGGLVRLRTATGGSVTGTAAATINTTGGRGQTGGAVTVGGIVGTDTLTTVNLAGAITADGGATAASGTLGGKNAGAVAIGNATTIAVGPISARGTNAGAAVGNNNVGGNGGAVTINRLGAASTVTLNGTIDTRGGDSAGTGNAGAGGNVLVDGGAAPNLGSLTVAGGANIDTRGGRGQTGGTVTIRDFTTIAMGGTAINTSGGAASSSGAGALGQGKNAGAVAITSTGASSVGAITAQGSAAVAGSGKVGGNGANANVTGVGVTLNGAISTRGGDSDGAGAGGNSGAVTVNGGAGGVTGLAAATITTTGGRGQTGGAVTVSSAAAGTVNLAGAITTAGGAAPTNAAGRAAGNVSVTGGSVTVGGIDTSGSAAAGAGVLAGGAAGTLALDATAGGGTITLNGNLATRGGDGAGGGVGGIGRNITLGDATRLNADVVIDARAGAGGAPAGGNVTFQSTLNSATATARNLTVNTNGATTFGGAVGATNALASVTTDAPGTTAINGGSVRTTGAQTYNDSVTLGAGTALTTTANGDVTANGSVNAGGNALALSTGAGNVTMLNAANNFTTVSVASANNVSLRDANAIDLGASTIAGNFALTANGAVTDAGALSITGTTTLGAGGANNITLDNGNDFGGAVTISSGNAVRLNDVSALTLAASSFGTLTATAGGALNVNGALTASGAGDAIVLAGASFQNNVGAGALVPGTGRWIVYSASPAGNTFGALASGNQALWGRTYPAAVPEPGNRYVFTAQPTLAFASTDVAKTYGQDATATVAGAYVVNGFVDASLYGNVFTQDTAANAVSGTPGVTSLGSPATASVAGSPYAINVSTAGVTSPTGYAITASSTGLLTVNPAALAVTANNQAKTYGQTITFTGTEFNSAGLQNGETIGTVTLASAGAPGTASVAGSPYAITPSNAAGGTFNPANYAITYNNGVLTVSPAALAVTANNQAKTYGQTITFTGTEFTPAGLQNGETIGSVTLASAGAPAAANVAGSPYAITASNAAGGTFNPANYAITYNNGVLTVNPAALAVTANNQAKTYGQTIVFAGTEFTSAGLQNGETIGSVTLASAGAPAAANVAGSPYAITASNATGGTFNPANYAITYNNGVLTVSPAALAVTANNQAKTYGQTVVFAGTEFTSAGLQNGETIGTVTLASAGAPGTASVAGSPYAITPSNATGGTFNPANYAITYNNGVLTVSAAALTVTANNQAKPYGQTFVFNGTEFTSAGLQNGETIGTVALASAGAPPTATVLGGPYAITASNAAGGTFNAANYVITYNNGVMTVTPLPITVTANNQAKVYGQPDPALTFTAPTVNGDVLAGALVRAPGETVAAGPYAITQGTVTNANNPNYNIAFVNGQLVITPAPLTIAADNKTRLYGDANPPLTATFTGLTNGDTTAAIPGVTLTTPAVPASNVGNYAINVTSGANTNYTITYVNGQLAITPAPLQIAADDKAKVFGAPNPSFTATATGFKLGQTVTDLNGTLVFTTPATTTSPPGAYTITPGGVSSGNYTITFIDGLLIVGQGAPPSSDQPLVSALGRNTLMGSGGVAPGATTNVDRCQLDALAAAQAGPLATAQRALNAASAGRSFNAPLCETPPK